MNSLTKKLSIVALFLSFMAISNLSYSQCSNLANYFISGGGSTNGGVTPVNIYLAYSSQDNVQYKLKRNGVTVSSKYGDGDSVLVWSNITAIGTYQIYAVWGGCEKLMNLNGLSSVTVTY